MTRKYEYAAEEYVFFRKWGMGHHQAVTHLATELGICTETVRNHIDRAMQNGKMTAWAD